MGHLKAIHNPFNDAVAAVAKKLHDGHTDQHIAVEDDDGLDLGRFAVAVDASCALRDGCSDQDRRSRGLFSVQGTACSTRSK